MRPSDVPTYVEAGAADLGITGKDVLLEQRDRAVYELLDLRYGACRMVLAGRKGDESLGEAERRLGAMRIATKYPRTAERYFQETGRQAEVIEVKGSVELAPIVGLADGIVDLVDTGRTLTENELEVREEIARCTARLGRQPRGPQAARGRGGRAGRAAAGGDAGNEDRAGGLGRRRRAGVRRPAASAGAGARRGDRRGRSGSSKRSEAAATPGCERSPSGSVRRCPSRSGSIRRLWRRHPGCSSPRCARRCASRERNIEAVARAELEARARPATAELPEGHRVEVREEPVAAAGVYAPGGRAAYPSSVLMCCVPARVAGVARICVASPPGAAGRPNAGGAGGLRDRRRGRGLRDRRSPGDRRPGLRHRDDRSGRPDRRAREPLRHRGQAAGLGRGRDRRDRRAHRADGGRRRHARTRSGSRSTSAHRASTATTAR